MNDDARMQRAIGQLEGRMGAFEAQIGDIARDVKAMRSTLNQARGGWRTLVVVGTLAGGIGAIVGKFLPFVR